jgi:hypothetical protein
MKQQLRFIGIYVVDTEVKECSTDLHNKLHDKKGSEKN